MTLTIPARSAPTAKSGTPTTTRKVAAARSRMSRSAPISAGPIRRRDRRWSCARVGRGDTEMPGINAQYLGMALQVAELDHDNLEYFRHCSAHDFHLPA